MARSRRQQALYGEPAAPVPRLGPPALARPRTEVEQLLNKQIALGEKILNMSQNDPNEMLKYIVETGKWRDYNRLLIKRCFTDALLYSEYDSSTSGSYVDNLGPDALIQIPEITGSVGQQIATLQSILHRLELFDEAPADRVERPASRDRSKVFVVHGHDEGAREAVARFIQALGFQPIILHERANEGLTVIEKVEAHGDVGFAVVLLTPDDEGCERGGTPGPRARQNVVLELGYFIGRLGRSRVCALKRGELEIPSDFGGVVYEPLDTSGGWKQKLGRELEAAGYEINWNTAMRS